jgi:hypothetical protein
MARGSVHSQPKPVDISCSWKMMMILSELVTPTVCTYSIGHGQENTCETGT